MKFFGARVHFSRTCEPVKTSIGVWAGCQRVCHKLPDRWVRINRRMILLIILLLRKQLYHSHFSVNTN